MKNLKRKITLLAVAAVISAGSITVMAANYQTPADIAASVTGKTVEDVIQERFNTGKAYGTIAAEAGKLDEFKAESLNIKEKLLSEDVEKGLLSKEEADNILNTIKERQAICDGTGYGNGRRCGYGCGLGFGRGQGAGFGYRNGSCLYYKN